MNRLLRSFGFSLALSVLGLCYALVALGAAAGLVVLILAAIELAFSFDNAVINAKVLTRLSPLWRTLFLTLGIVIAIFVVRALLPVIIVGLTAHLPLGTVADLALHQPKHYAHELELARPGITAFGGAFLLMLALHFFLAVRDVRWLKLLESPLSKFEYWWLPLFITVVTVCVLALLPGNEHPGVSLTASLAGVAAYTAINGGITLLNRLFGEGDSRGQQVGWAALATFFYLEVLDGSLSFDGVIGAFAITTNVILIGIGLGIGAVWVRSLTVYMVRHRTLEQYRFLEHGAHYAILALACSMLLASIFEVPNFVIGPLCLSLIAAALVTSRQAVEKHAAAN